MIKTSSRLKFQFLLPNVFYTKQCPRNFRFEFHWCLYWTCVTDSKNFLLFCKTLKVCGLANRPTHELMMCPGVAIHGFTLLKAHPKHSRCHANRFFSLLGINFFELYCIFTCKVSWLQKWKRRNNWNIREQVKLQLPWIWIDASPNNGK